MSLWRVVMTRGAAALRVAGGGRPSMAARAFAARAFATTAQRAAPGADQGDGADGAGRQRGSTAFWSDDYVGMSAEAFPEELSKVLMAPLDANDIEIKPDGLLYLPEIKYRRVLNRSFGPGGWAMKPLSPNVETAERVSREYGLYCQGRFVAQATGEHSGSIVGAAAAESAKSNALMRCCKDIGVASELWDPQFILEWKSKHTVAVWCVNVRTDEKRKLWRRKDRPAFEYPWKEGGAQSGSASARKRAAAPTPVSAQPADPVSVASPSPVTPAQPGGIPFTSPVTEDASFGAAFDVGTGSSSSGSGSMGGEGAAVSEVETVRGAGGAVDVGDVETYLDNEVPKVLKKYRNKTWREVAADSRGVGYLNWIKTSFNDDTVAAMAGAVLDYKAAGN